MVRALETPSRASYSAQFERLEQLRRGREPDWLSALRAEALERFLELGLPTTHSEGWKYTNLGALARRSFVPVLEPPPAVLREDCEPLRGDCAIRLTFADGHLVRTAPEAPLPDGLRVRALSEVIAREPDLLRRAFSVGEVTAERALEALHTAFCLDGALVHVPRGLVVERPIHLVFVSTAGDEPQVAFPRVVIVAGAESRVTVVESHVPAGGERYWTTALTRVRAESGAVVDHVRLQEESDRAFHVAVTDALVERDARFRSHVLALGAALGRDEVRVSFAGAGGACELHGLYVADGERHLDCQTFVDHAVARCKSEQLYRGIMTDRARGVFGGRVLVREDAQKSDASQSTRSLLLSRKASADAKPQLEIHADDVRCTHGATVSQLEEDHVFYLRSRGVDEGVARRMLALGFAGAVLGDPAIAPVAARAERLLRERLAGRGDAPDVPHGPETGEGV